MEGVFLFIGLVFGGIELLIKGKNLDIGLDLVVFVGVIECSV